MTKEEGHRILHDLKSGQQSAFKELYDIFYLPLVVYSFKICDSYEMAEDIVQGFFLNFWEKRIYETIEKDLANYMISSVKFNTLNALKKNKRFVFENLEQEVDALIDGEGLVDKQKFEQEFQKLLVEIEKLPEKGRLIFESIIFQNMKYKEVADKFDISVNTVKTHYLRALQKLRGSIDVILMLLMV
jgi:RNA polymerase sigma-70 factor (ECF subfamily)